MKTLRKQPVGTRVSIPKVPRGLDVKKKPVGKFGKWFLGAYRIGEPAHKISRWLNSEHSHTISRFLSKIYTKLRDADTITLFLTSSRERPIVEHYVTLSKDPETSQFKTDFASYIHELDEDSPLTQAIRSNNGGKAFFFNETRGRLRVFSPRTEDFTIGAARMEKSEGKQTIVIPIRAWDSPRVLGCLVIKGSDLRLRKKWFKLSAFTFLSTAARYMYSVISRQLDSLTKLMNREVFHGSLAANIDQYLRNPQNTGNNFSLIACDIDHFKLYNDRFSHQMGDRKLVEVAIVLRSTARSLRANPDDETERPDDLVARVGGEEFTELLENTDLGGALSAASRRRKTIRANVEGLDGKPLTCSFGVLDAETAYYLWKNHYIDTENIKREVEGFEHMSESQQFAEVMKYIADQALYAAKEAGRDRVSYAAKVKPGESIYHVYESHEDPTSEFRFSEKTNPLQQ